MKTTITDNSLCTLPFSEETKPEYISNYIEALAQTGVKYAEVDFRTVMKMRELPDCMGYIFRLADPMFAKLASVYDFSYVVVTVNDLRADINVGDTPVIMEFPAMSELSGHVLDLAQTRISGKISMLRMRGSYSMMSYADAAAYIWRAKNAVTVPIDLCPMNVRRAAVDFAIKAAMANVDNLTLCMGRSVNYASLEDFLFSLMTVHDALPREFNMQSLCRAEIYHRLVFGEKHNDCLTDLLAMLDSDIAMLTNADTGEQVKMRVTLKDKHLLRKTYTTALMQLIEAEDIPDDIAEDIIDALRLYDFSMFSSEAVHEKDSKLLN